MKWREAVKKRREEKLVIVSNFISVIPKKATFCQLFEIKKSLFYFHLHSFWSLLKEIIKRNQKKVEKGQTMQGKK